MTKITRAMQVLLRISRIIAQLLLGLFTIWAAGALYYDLPAPLAVRTGTSILWIAGMAVLWWAIRPPKGARLAAIAASVVLLAWWLSLQPRQDRDWQPELSRTAHAEIAGDQVTVHNVRNFEYRTAADFTPRYETRTYDLRRLTGIDLFINYWGLEWMAHPILSFVFTRDDGTIDRLCFSIETRPERGEKYSAIGGLYRQYELIYIAADERDVIQLRTNYRKGEDLYLYKLNISPVDARERFLEYISQINALNARPRWYNAISSNCTTSIRAQHDAARRAPFDWRMLLNGKMDEMLYASGVIDTSVSFAELKQRAHINKRAEAAGNSPQFSERIRARE